MNGIIVTGGSGFIGSTLVEYLLKKYPKRTIINISKLTYAVNPAILDHLLKEKNYKFCEMDLRDGLGINKIIRKYQVSEIYHLAAQTHVDRSFKYPREFVEANILGTFELLEVLRNMNKKKRPRFIQMSTDEVFGDVPKGFCREDDKILPRNPYSGTKAGAEMLCHSYFHSFNLPIIIVRYMNNFGPRQHPEKLIPKIITHCLMNKHYTLFKGASVRGWLYVGDTPEVLDILMHKGKLGEIYHTPPVAYKTVPEINEIILGILDKESLFDGYQGKRLKDDERYALDGSKVRYTFNWSPPTSMKEGLEKTIEWYKKNKWFWERFI